MVRLEEKRGTKSTIFPDLTINAVTAILWPARVFSETLRLSQPVYGKFELPDPRSGYTIDVLDHYRADINQKWLLTAVHHQ